MSIKGDKMAGRETEYNEEVANYICEQIAESRGLRAILREDTQKNLPNLIKTKGEENLAHLIAILNKYGELPASSTIFKWLLSNNQFSEQYARARIVQAHVLIDEIKQIADDGHNDTYIDDEGKRIVDYDIIQRSRLRVDARKWLATKLAPKVYGDKIEQTFQNPDGTAIKTNIEVTFRRPDDIS